MNSEEKKKFYQNKNKIITRVKTFTIKRRK